MTVAAILLAAGRSTRFGSDKLVAPLADLPLAQHAALTLAALPVLRFVVTGDGSAAWPGFTPILNPVPEAGMGHSLALGMAAARAANASAVLVALADMPFVTIAHYRRLLDRHRGADSLVASGDGTTRMPPALFGSAWFETLASLTGDRGARALLDRAELVGAPAAELRDIDRPEDLAAAGAATHALATSQTSARLRPR